MMTYIVGFTGRRDGMDFDQKVAVRAALAGIQVAVSYPIIGLHGDCVGADLEFDEICRELRIPTACMPCTWKGEVEHRLRAFTEAEEWAEPCAPLTRNRRIVEKSHVLIGTPPTPEYEKRSGTWFTVHHAESRNVPCILIPPYSTVSLKVYG